MSLPNIFHLHGKYFEDCENRLTANLVFLLSELRSSFLPEFLRSVGIRRFNTSKIEFVIQPSIMSRGLRKFPDCLIRQDDEFLLIIEAKVGTNPLLVKQLRCYAEDAAKTPARVKRVVAITQINEGRTFSSARANIEARLLPKGSCACLRWFEVIRTLRNSLRLTPSIENAIIRKVLRGSKVDYGQRLAMLFLDEVERAMFERLVVDDLPAGQLQDIRVTVQDPWYINVAKKHNAWFPDGSLTHGLKPSRWAAFYETAESKTRAKQISYLARNLTFWNRVTLDDVRTTPELSRLWKDLEVRRRMKKWCNNDRNATFHVVLTDKPTQLAHPIRLDGSKRARFLNKKLFPIEKFINAATVDDLFTKA